MSLVSPAQERKVWECISMVHGPRRYEPGQGLNGAVSLIEPSPEWDTENDIGSPGGPGSVWAWFVGSPRAFLFGFERSKSWASRRMRTVLKDEAKPEASAGLQDDDIGFSVVRESLESSINR